eukprot:8177600-Alexandrium_andersonii.AAC.1
MAGGHSKAILSFGAGGEGKRARLFLSPLPGNRDPEECIFQAAKEQLKVRHDARPLMGWETLYEVPPDTLILQSTSVLWTYHRDM